MHRSSRYIFFVGALTGALFVLTACGAYTYSTLLSMQPAAVAEASAELPGNCDSLTGVSSFAGRNMPELANGGKVSVFGGPDDTGVTATEGLALGNLPGDLFLPESDPRIAGKNYGLARKLNPDAFYVAARWPYTNAFRKQALPESSLGSKSSYDGGFPVLIEANGIKIVAWAVDYGPHGNTTDKDIDLSPGAARALGLETGDTIAALSYVTDPNVGPSTCFGDTSTSLQRGTTISTPAPQGGAPVNLPRSFMWSTTPFCFKHTGSARAPLVSKAPSCNGGFTTIPPEPVPVPISDCGPGSALCTIPTGCLNAICAAHSNAIWDPISKTCGCG